MNLNKQEVHYLASFELIIDHNTKSDNKKGIARTSFNV